MAVPVNANGAGQPPATAPQQPPVQVANLGRDLKAYWLNPTQTVMDSPMKAMAYTAAFVVASLFVALINAFAGGVILGATIVLLGRVFIINQQMFTDNFIDTITLRSIIPRREPAPVPVAAAQD